MVNVSDPDFTHAWLLSQEGETGIASILSGTMYCWSFNNIVHGMDVPCFLTRKLEFIEAKEVL